MAAGDAFPRRADLDAAAEELERASAQLAERVRVMTSKARRKTARSLLKETWFAVESLRAAEPASQPALLAMRAARDLDLALASALGVDPHASLKLPAGTVSATSATASPLAPPPDPMRLDWPIRYDLDRIERLGEPGRQADAMAGRLDDAAAEIEARARRAAGLSPVSLTERELEPEVDMDGMELARAQPKKRPGPGGS